VSTIVVTNGTLTDDGNGQASLDFGSAATDGSAIHDNESGEIQAITEKASPVSNDLLLIEDSANDYAKKAVKISNLPAYTQGARVYNSANISTTNAAFTVLTFNSERYDTDDIHSTTTDTSRLTCKTAGKYLIVANVEFAAHTTGVRGVQIRLNGSTTAIADSLYQATSGGYTTIINMSTICDLAVNDYVECHVYQNSGGALNVISRNYRSPQFMMQRIG